MKQQLILSRMTCSLIAAAVCLVGLAAGTVEAALITPTGATASSELGIFGADHLIDDSGLSGISPHTTSDTHALSSTPNHNSWASTEAAPTVTFELDGTYLLSEVHIWNYANAANAFQVAGIDVTFSTGGIAGTFSGTQSITLTADGVPTSAQTNSLTPVLANAVRFQITSLVAGNTVGDGGLSEVKFTGTAVTSAPEPSTFALSALGLLGLGFVGRRRRRR